MNRIKAWVRATLGFSRTETNAFIVLLPLMFLIIFAQPFYQAWFTSRQQNYSKERSDLDSLLTTWEWSKKKDSVVELKRVSHFFRFNPNTASAEALESLGLNSLLVKRIINYRNKGGKFRIKSDVQKIYGMDSLWFKSALAYIDLPESILKISEPTTLTTEKKIIARFDLNLADTSQLIGIYGIGSKLAARIVKYRQKLGGFIVVNQLKEVYGLDSLVISRLEEKTYIDSNFVPVALNLNLLTEKELASHPYLNWKIAKAITAYRFQHGHFKSLDDLTHLKLIDEQTFQRVKPYLTLD